MAGDPYTGYGSQVDVEANRFFADQAKKEGSSVSGWMARNGIIGSALESRLKDHERPMAAVPPKLLAEAEVRAAEESWNDHVPGGAVIPSIIGTGKLQFKADLPKRRRGRPVKNFVKGRDDGLGR